MGILPSQIFSSILPENNTNVYQYCKPIISAFAHFLTLRHGRSEQPLLNAASLICAAITLAHFINQNFLSDLFCGKACPTRRGETSLQTRAHDDLSSATIKTLAFSLVTANLCFFMELHI